jgi:hypothetical protein
MRIAYATCLLSLVALAGCAKANAATIDPNNDFDCAVAFQFYSKLAELAHAPVNQQEATAAMNLWFGTKWGNEHPGEGPKQKDHYKAMINALGKDPVKYRYVMKSCADRAVAHPRFNAFAARFHQEFSKKF